MALALIYKISDSKILLGIPNSDAPDKARLSRMVGVPESDLASVMVDDASLDALNVQDETGRINIDLLKIENGVVARNAAYDQPRADRLVDLGGKKAARKAAKAEAKLKALADMTQQDFMNLSANDRWQTVFAFMKAHLDDGV